ncbi:hypothetical protein M2M59_14685 [Rummeliibacillus sp. G93]|uniref:hypothetical protein n=1 Tax=Rummeliibacillus sp. G93 TaxID=2939494 RepID=UPI00201C326E|nr:hypothetical protein [Rummeliibacillus sp. G93]UQW97144.1 hypothetical protein M2M59_14685 [Rummeliibacillus sp. G93]
MIKSNKITILILMFSLIIFGFNVKHASATHSNNLVKTLEKRNELVVDNNTTLVFDTNRDKNSYMRSLASTTSNQLLTMKSSSKSPGGGRLIDTKTKKGIKGGYATSSWAKSNLYVMTASKTFRFEGSYEWHGTLGIGFDFTKGVEVHIPANKKKWSRVGLYADYKFSRYKKWTPNMSVPIYYTEKKRLASYYKIVYKKK